MTPYTLTPRVRQLDSPAALRYRWQPRFPVAAWVSRGAVTFRRPASDSWTLQLQAGAPPFGC
eukprot:7812951-Alexandrium_andersonii.AAC.1